MTFPATYADPEPRARPWWTFGDNWKRYVAEVTERQIIEAARYFREFTGRESLDGENVLDIGCGSGVHSLIFNQLGASVTSVDIDEDSVTATREIRKRRETERRWRVIEADILQPHACDALIQRHSYVYAWGSLHHTGMLWRALDNAVGCVGPRGYLHVAIYNACSSARFWWWVKRLANRWPRAFGLPALWLYRCYGLLRLHGRRYNGRGMTFLRDTEDWIYGWPYEYASVPEVVGHLRKGFRLVSHKPVGSRRHGCNEFLFQRKT